MFDNDIWTSASEVTLTRYSKWEDEWVEIDALELEISFCKKTFLDNLTDSEIKDIISQDDWERIVSEIEIERPELGITIKGYITDEYYSGEPCEAMKKFKQHVLNGILLYMMTKVSL